MTADGLFFAIVTALALRGACALLRDVDVAKARVQWWLGERFAQQRWPFHKQATGEE